MTTPETSPQNISLFHQPLKDGPWESYSTDSRLTQDLFHIKITHVGQCEETACREQNEAFHIADLVEEDKTASYGYKYVLDMDGNGFSGRYYRLLDTHSAIIKQTLIQEWHDDWLVPWYHYIPLSMQADEFPEMMRFFATTERGDEIGSDIARASTDWAGKVLRDVDFELVMFRLLLEYGRLFDEERV